MIVYEDKNKSLIFHHGGYLREGMEITDTFVRYDRNLSGMLYRPVLPDENSRIGILVMHATQDYTDMNICPELAKRGFTVFGSRVQDPAAALDQKLLDVKKAVTFLKALPGVEKIILLGHSGGATLMSAYQRAAENGVASIQKENLLYQSTIAEELTAADGCMFIDSNYGNGAMTLISIDPAVLEEDCGMKLNPAYDIYNPETGYSPEGTAYKPEFLKDYFAAQGQRNNKIIRMALDRLSRIRHGKGRYLEDEPFCVPASAQTKPYNKLINQDLHLLNHTRGVYPLLHGDGTVTNETVYCLRKVFNRKRDSRGIGGAYIGTVRSYLSEQAVWAHEDYAFAADGVRGIGWDECFSCTPGNVKEIHCPVLTMGMTGSYEYAAAEYIMENCPSGDKTIAFVEGADHMISPNHDAEAFPGQFGDTQKLTYDYIAAWLSAGRF